MVIATVLMSLSVETEQGPADFFKDVNYVRDGASIPVEVAISATHLRITTVSPSECRKPPFDAEIRRRPRPSMSR